MSYRDYYSRRRHEFASRRLWRVVCAFALAVGLVAMGRPIAPAPAAAASLVPVGRHLLTRQETRPQTFQGPPPALRLTGSGLTARAPSSPRQVSHAITAGASTHTVSWDGSSFMIDGKRVFIRSAEFHYWRLPSPGLWLDVLQKIKAEGFNTVQIYFDWGFHSPKQGVYDFTGVRDVEKVLQLTEQVGLYVIARPGPYINAETDSGGFPGWADTIAGKARTSVADYTAAYMEWLSQIDPILARHQITAIDPATGLAGSIIIAQVENEYTFGFDATYMQDIEDKFRADGITVPTDHNDAVNTTQWSKGPGAVDMYAFDDYPLGFNCADPQNWNNQPAVDDPESFESNSRAADPTDPVFIAEYQGGSFDPWGGPGYAKCYQLTGPDFVNVFYKTAIAQGATLFNAYMGYGGTSWGWLPFPGVYSSYDYGAAIDEARQLTGKYDEFKRLNDMLEAVAPLRMTQPMNVTGSNPAVDYRGRLNPTTGTQFFILRHTPIDSTNDDTTTITINSTDGSYVVPRQPGTGIRINGRDSKVLIAHYDMGGQHLVYSTSELMTHAAIGARDVALFYGRAGEDGETVLRYAAPPTVTVLSGSIITTFTPLITDTLGATDGDLRLDYTHDASGQIRLLIQGGGRPDLLLIIGDDDEAARYWPDDTSAGPVLVRGPYLVRTAALTGTTLALTGDTTMTTPLEVFAPPGVTGVTWNGTPVATTVDAYGALAGSLAGPPSYTLPRLTDWRFHVESPETQPAFDDASWTVADHITTTNPTKSATLPVLYMDDYGYHYGDVWYRGHFTAIGSETAITIDGEGGNYDAYAVWLNGAYLGSYSQGSASTGTAQTFAFPAGSLRPGADNVISVLLENMGHEEDFLANDSQKAPRGLAQAVLWTASGSAPPIAWRIQGAYGGEDTADPTRGQFNNGGLYGERAGWYLPDYDDGAWTLLTLPDHWQARGVPAGVGWYRTGFDLRLPPGTDIPLGLRITDDKARHYRALIYLNGWLLGRYINDLGPQTLFSLPTGILNPNGHNELAIASWGLDNTTGGLGTVTLEAYGAYAGGVPAGLVDSPGVCCVKILPPPGGTGGGGTPTATPEPGSGALYATGLAALLAGASAWRRRRRARPRR